MNKNVIFYLKLTKRKHTKSTEISQIDLYMYNLQ